MTWPLSRLTTYAAGSQVKSVDLDAIQDQIIALSTARVSARFPELQEATASTWKVEDVSGLIGGASAFSVLHTAAAGHAVIDLFEVEQGERMTSLSLAVYGDGAAGLLDLRLEKVFHDGTANEFVGFLELSASPAAWADATFSDLRAYSATGLTVSVTAPGSNGVYTRTAGSFITDGFAVGQAVTWTGFANSNNNVVGGFIVALSALVMTVRSDGHSWTAEAGATPVAVHTNDIAPDGTFNLQLRLTTSNTAPRFVKCLRVGHIPL